MHAPLPYAAARRRRALVADLFCGAGSLSMGASPDFSHNLRTIATCCAPVDQIFQRHVCSWRQEDAIWAGIFPELRVQRMIASGGPGMMPRVTRAAARVSLARRVRGRQARA